MLGARGGPCGAALLGLPPAVSPGTCEAKIRLTDTHLL